MKTPDMDNGLLPSSSYPLATNSTLQLLLDLVINFIAFYRVTCRVLKRRLDDVNASDNDVIKLSRLISGSGRNNRCVVAGNDNYRY